MKRRSARPAERVWLAALALGAGALVLSVATTVGSMRADAAARDDGVPEATARHASPQDDPTASQRKGKNRADRAVDALFDRWDADDDGRVGSGEGPHGDFFRKVDGDGDGWISRDEVHVYLAIWRQGRDAATQRFDPRRAKLPMRWSLDIPYIEGIYDPQRTLDVYSPDTDTDSDTEDAAPRPIVVMIHGGGFVIGDKRTPPVAARKAPAFVQAGFVFASVNYRLSPEFQHPAHVADVAAALAWLHDNAGSFGGDPDRIIVMGHSAGAHLAALVAIDGRYLEEVGQSPDIIAGVVLLDGGAYDMPKRVDRLKADPQTVEMFAIAFGTDRAHWAAASPTLRVRTEGMYPPFLLFHVARRTPTRVLAEDLAGRLRKAGGRAEVRAVDGRDHHGLNAAIGKPDDPTTREIVDFVRQAAARSSG